MALRQHAANTGLDLSEVAAGQLHDGLAVEVVQDTSQRRLHPLLVRNFGVAGAQCMPPPPLHQGPEGFDRIEDGGCTGQKEQLHLEPLRQVSHRFTPVGSVVVKHHHTTSQVVSEGQLSDELLDGLLIRGFGQHRKLVPKVRDHSQDSNIRPLLRRQLQWQRILRLPGTIADLPEVCTTFVEVPDFHAEMQPLVQARKERQALDPHCLGPLSRIQRPLWLPIRDLEPLIVEPESGGRDRGAQLLRDPGGPGDEAHMHHIVQHQRICDVHQLLLGELQPILTSVLWHKKESPVPFYVSVAHTYYRFHRQSQLLRNPAISDT